MSKKTAEPVKVAPKWCKGCGICIEFCPKKVLDYDDKGKVKVTKPEECIKCGLCELRCPDFAIVVKKEDESDEK
ncbi:4Fe-4S dicluster domain-containing protein [Natranaerobius thermophilus]|uniref:4Fe-4S ferredoxin iron-sulfur binding domain protein n=1 Tax=Natranaerobius thermophilus (strain ATCC BAA-1301 / DSM 18059 / JW/NM-WN-LF) TaxID=457570 RepID=B2A3W2_NATTJ|nr:4Fe-4S binding protein [Natranaerobius thermophilus]ACB85064.1 4Fe-4S ferredoxin iron-sulfur binding domain protein [Natranaerobius thermophilus JW/NM-WN-LF]